jgi:hypothetical protein
MIALRVVHKGVSRPMCVSGTITIAPELGKGSVPHIKVSTYRSDCQLDLQPWDLSAGQLPDLVSNLITARFYFSLALTYSLPFCISATIYYVFTLRVPSQAMRLPCLVMFGPRVFRQPFQRSRRQNLHCRFSVLEVPKNANTEEFAKN